MIQLYTIQLEGGICLYCCYQEVSCVLTLSFFSFGDISAEAMFEDMDKLCIGILLMFVYMQIVLSEFNPIKLRVS